MKENPMVLYKYQSSKWDMNITLEELLESNQQCKVGREYKAHKYDDCFHGYCMYLKYPKTNKYSVMVGICEDGFIYIGDSCGNEELPLENTEGITKEMFFFGEWVKQKEINLCKLI